MVADQWEARMWFWSSETWYGLRVGMREEGEGRGRDRRDEGDREGMFMSLKRVEWKWSAMWWAWFSLRGLFSMLTDCWAYSGTRLLVSVAAFSGSIESR